MKTVMRVFFSLVVAAPLGFAGDAVSRASLAVVPNKALCDYLGDPVALPANMDAAYTKEGFTRAIHAAAEAANISLTKVEVDDTEFPFLVGVVCANKGDIEKLKAQIRTVTAYEYTGGVGGDTICAMNFVPYSAVPTDARERVHRRMVVREAILYDKISGKQ